jgi:serine/threonine protein kinase
MNIYIQLILAVDELHRHNIIHRDIKSENVFVDVDDNAKLGDFGCGRILEMNEKVSSMEGSMCVIFVYLFLHAPLSVLTWRLNLLMENRLLWLFLLSFF